MVSLAQLTARVKLHLGWWIASAVTIGVALVGRFWRLADFPAGMHQDEAWFAYNAWLLLKSGSNIYGEKWPLTVDMWGDHVSAIHSYLLVPFIALFGSQVTSYRAGIIVAGCIAAIFALWWLYRQTRNKLVVLLAAVLWAVSPWSIVMSRASSSVMVDSMMLTLLVLVASTVFEQAAVSQLRAAAAQRNFILGLVGMYGLTIVCYVTYFTSRLLIPPFLVLLAVYTWWQHRAAWPRLLTIGIVAVITTYLIFPFGALLRTPYALGRYQETAILGSDTVKGALTAHIAQAGQAGISPLVTRLRYNKLSENFSAFWQQYIGLLSPSVLLFQNGPPARYSVPNGLSVTGFEYLGIILALAYIILGSNVVKSRVSGLTVLQTSSENLRPLVMLSLGFVLIAAVPSALTQDDFPNLQRAVIMVPWVQIVSALGWFVTIKSVLSQLPLTTRWQKLATAPVIITALVLLLSAPSLFSFWFGYVAQTPFERPFNRSRAGEELAKWINANAHDAKIIEEHVEGVFFYPYLFASEDLRTLPITKPGKYFLTAKDFWIGQRHFVSDLCASPELAKQPYDYYIFFTLHTRCSKVGTMKKVFEAKYDDGSVGFTVYQPLPATSSAQLAVPVATPSVSK